MISSILLAAGQSKRMQGENKLLKKYKKKYLINHILKSLIKSKVNKIIVVLGHENRKIKKIALKSKKITFVVNSQYLKGISTSIKHGLKKISKKNIGFLIVHADMPLVSKTILNTLCSALKIKNKEIFVPTYKKKVGNPLAFKYSMIKSLKKIKGDRGAKKLTRSNKSKVQLMKMKSKSILIDFDQLKDFPSAT
jgi:molybdenum cofactor cytidylyltransferase